VTISGFDVSPLLATSADAIFVDARFNLADARAYTKVLATADVTLPVFAVLKEVAWSPCRETGPSTICFSTRPDRPRSTLDSGWRWRAGARWPGVSRGW
jgi:hypothetical protein